LSAIKGKVVANVVKKIYNHENLGARVLGRSLENNLM
jgi:hypothetical protein